VNNANEIATRLVHDTLGVEPAWANRIKKARTKKAHKKEQKAEADLASLLKRDKDSVRSAINHTVDAKEAEMVTKYGLSVHDDTVGGNVPASDDIGTKLAAARARAADAQYMAATLNRESKTLTTQKKLSSEAKRKGKGKKPAGISIISARDPYPDFPFACISAAAKRCCRSFPQGLASPRAA
jgi:hypothetical protein